MKLQRLAIPTTQVYPLFIKLAETWRSLQDETLVLSRSDSLRRIIYDHTRCLAKLPYKALAKQFGCDKRQGDSCGRGTEYDDEDGDVVEASEDFVCKLARPEDVNGSDITIAYGGKN